MRRLLGSPYSSCFLRPRKTVGMLALAVWLLGLPADADVRLPGLFTDHLVLQRGKPLPVWGWADPGERVIVHFRKQTATATASPDGEWRVTLRPEKIGKPSVLRVSGRNTIEIRDVLVGEVWICSGQSNMEWPLSASHDAAAAIASSANPRIRLFTVPKHRSETAQVDVPARWEVCAPGTVPRFSAVGYYFGRALQRERQVPVGLINTSWGGSPAEVWVSPERLGQDPEYRRDILESYPPARARHDQAVARWEQERDAAKAAGAKFDKARPREPWRPTELFLGMIAPLVPYAVQGAIWYQGESNVGRAAQYRRLFADLILDWRAAWGQKDFTFLAVELAPWDKNRKRPLDVITATPVESDWAELREAQGYVARTLPQVGLAVITDVGDKDDIHPTKKTPVGERLALAARVLAYGERVHGLSPVFRSATFGDGKAMVRFDRVGRGLEARGGELTGFAIAGADRKFVWARAEIRGKDTIEVFHPSVKEPVAVRFGWADYPVVNLYSRGGLPVSPFRTDTFPTAVAPGR